MFCVSLRKLSRCPPGSARDRTAHRDQTRTRRTFRPARSRPCVSVPGKSVKRVNFAFSRGLCQRSGDAARARTRRHPPPRPAAAMATAPRPQSTRGWSAFTGTPPLRCEVSRWRRPDLDPRVADVPHPALGSFSRHRRRSLSDERGDGSEAGQPSPARVQGHAPACRTLCRHRTHDTSRQHLEEHTAERPDVRFACRPPDRAPARGSCTAGVPSMTPSCRVRRASLYGDSRQVMLRPPVIVFAKPKSSTFTRTSPDGTPARWRRFAGRCWPASDRGERCLSRAPRRARRRSGAQS